MLKTVALSLVLAAVSAFATPDDISCREESKSDKVGQFVVRPRGPSQEPEIYFGKFSREDGEFHPATYLIPKTFETQSPSSKLPRRIAYLCGGSFAIWLRLTADGTSGNATFSTNEAVKFICWAGDPNQP